MNPTLHDLLQALLNLIFGLSWGNMLARLFPPSAMLCSNMTSEKPAPYRSLWLWVTLLVFVSVRWIGDVVMSQPGGTLLETVNLYAYATAFFVGLWIAVNQPKTPQS